MSDGFGSNSIRDVAGSERRQIDMKDLGRFAFGLVQGIELYKDPAGSVSGSKLPGLLPKISIARVLAF